MPPQFLNIYKEGIDSHPQNMPAGRSGCAIGPAPDGGTNQQGEHCLSSHSLFV
jgi:hypothetical protein